MKIQKGFTLIELLVVIAIIGILASVTLASLSSSRNKARYTRAYSDMNEIAKAAELDIVANTNYRADGVNGVSPGFPALTSWPVPPCGGWTYDWDNWIVSQGGSVERGAVRVSMRRPDSTAAYYYCVATNNDCAASTEGGVNIRSVKSISCN